MSGEWDYLLQIVVADVGDYNHLLMQTLLGHPFVARGFVEFRAVDDQIFDRVAGVSGHEPKGKTAA